MADRERTFLRVQKHRAAKAGGIDRRHQDAAPELCGACRDSVAVVDAQVDVPLGVEFDAATWEEPDGTVAACGQGSP